METTSAPKFEETSPEGSPDLDDLLTDAQDALFDGNMETMIAICEKIVKSNPKESSAYELLVVGYISKQPPDYSGATDCAINWGKACGFTSKQLTSWLKTSFYSNDIQRCCEAAKQILSQKGMIMEKALAAALMADLNQLKYAREIAQKVSEKMFSEEDLSDPELLFTQALITWVDICSDKREEGGKVLTEIAMNSPMGSDESATKEAKALCYGLVILELSERDHFKAADSWLQRAKQSGFGDYPNVIAAQALYYYYTLATPSPGQAHNVSGKIEQKVKELARSSVSQCHHLLKKRLESKILNI